ncbi:hypothetical protein G6N76_09530 [Rhizobium daejeonense]|uniref:DUF7666 domain-containing protein n=1 Tax=Rhizobium daejeonense TaxID=240521 RepID=A0A6M1SB17_9HYPH|nr:hypothetical protein [Rhizobium daejeonense]NGO63916.1 hypothetical protein [Rhizobium daejeonense]
MARRATKTAAVESAATTSLTTYKGFNKDWTCRDFQYEVGKTYEHEGAVVRCASGGFHSCEHPLDTWTYYEPNVSRFAQVTASGDIDREHGGDTKIASGKLTIDFELSLGDMARKAVAYVAGLVKASLDTNVTAGYGAHSSTAGEGAHSSTAGTRAHSSTAGTRAHSSTAGEGAHSSTAGTRAHSSTAGYGAHSSTAGEGAHSSTAGEGAHSSTAGTRAHSSTAGEGAHSSTAGEGAHSSTAGYGAHSEVNGDNSIAHSAGRFGTASAVAGSAISLAAYDESVWPPKLIAVRSSMVGENGIEAGKRYRLTTAGEFEEVSE